MNTPTEYSSLIKDAHKEFIDNNMDIFHVYAKSFNIYNERILTLTDKQKVGFIIEAIETICRLGNEIGKISLEENQRIFLIQSIWRTFMEQISKTGFALDDDDIECLINSFYNHKRYYRDDVFSLPASELINKIEKQTIPPSPRLLKLLVDLRGTIESISTLTHRKEKARALEKIDTILFRNQNGINEAKPTWFKGEDRFTEFANNTIRQASEAQQQIWFKLMVLSQKGASASKPNAKYMNESFALIKELGEDVFKATVLQWFQFITKLKEEVTEKSIQYYREGILSKYLEFLDSNNSDMIKGFLWMCAPFQDKDSLLQISLLAERCYKKIKDKGPASPAIGNACLYVLANARGIDGIAQLSRLRMRVKQNTAEALIEKYLTQAASDQDVSMFEVEDMAVDDFGLTNAQRGWILEGYTAKLSIVGVGKTEIQWKKADNTLQKTVPKLVKEKCAAELKTINNLAKQIALNTSAQRDRIDKLLKSDRRVSWQHFKKCYLDHGLMCYLTQKLVWVFEQASQKQSVIYLDNKWQHPQGELSFTPDDSTTVKLWHPAFDTLENIQRWRQFIIDLQIVQPLKQVFREVYLLTDAEINTRTYSNRMAAHLIKQHQFNSLAKIRGWRYLLMGPFNGKFDGIARLNLPEVGLRAEFWVSEITIDDESINLNGIWMYVSTGQVRFHKLDTNQTVELKDVPPLVFSEVMRDVDLFVGVTSVGNDPAWMDNGGLVAYESYWKNYSFSELTEIAKTRKEILERLVPRLKIASQCDIQDRYLVVKGKLRTYKIHIGSANILMLPNDQYLCIVPEQKFSSTTPEKVFLPFEGDNVLSIILSKAFLLANDTKITDPTITSQIKRTI